MKRVHILGTLGFACLAAAAVGACEDRKTPQGAGGEGGEGGAGGAQSGVVIPGLSGEVKAVYDEYGLLHLECTTDDDCYSALGYFHAQNRFFFMDFVRNLVRGKLGALVQAGDLVLQQDYANRRFFSTPSGEPLETALYQNASPRVRGHLDAYARGVNAWIADMREGRNGATLTTEYDFALIVKSAIREWEPEDSAAVGLYVLNDLSNNSGAELALAAALPAYPPELAADLFSPKPVFEAFTAPLPSLGLRGSGARSSASHHASSELYRDAIADLALVGSGASIRTPGEIGSNNWVVSGARTSSGRPLLANDPHLALTNPSIWFAVELDAKSRGTGDYHVAGSTFPGLPAVMVGHNESIGWGVTTAVYDLADVYVEELNADRSAVVFGGAEVPIVEKTYSFFDASTNTTIDRSFRYVPHHGPIVSEDESAGTAVSIRWVGHRAGTDLDGFFGVARAGTREEARKAIESISSANQNFVVVDREGEIGWYPYGEIPKRSFASASLPPWLPLPGDGTAEWDGFVPIADLPQLTNPASGAIATANQDMTGAYADGDPLNDGQAALQGYRVADGSRQQRILDELERVGDAHSIATMEALQGDTFSLYGEFVVPRVLEAVDGVTLTENEQALIDALEAWQFTCPTGLVGDEPASAKSTDVRLAADSIGCTAFHATFFAIVDQALRDEIAAAGVSPGGFDLTFVARALRDPGSIASGDLLWDDVSTANVVETREDILLRAVRIAAARLSAVGPADDWRWGRLHTLSLRSIFDNFGLVEYNTPDYAAPGGLYTVNVANPRRVIPKQGDPWDFSFTNGASVRFVVEVGNEGPRMTYQLPGGADLHRESPFYNNLLPLWLRNESVAFPFGPGAVEDPAVEVLVSPPR